MTQSPPPLLSQVIERIGAELAAQAEAIRDLHALAEGLPSNEALVRAQAIDTSSQHLGELATLLQCLATAAGDAAAPETCFEAMTLSGLRARLLGQAEDAADAGEVDFF